MEARQKLTDVSELTVPMVVVPGKFELHRRMHDPIVWCKYETILILGQFSSFFGYIISGIVMNVARMAFDFYSMISRVV